MMTQSDWSHLTNTDHSQVFLRIFYELKSRGKIVKPRGEKVIELEDFFYVLPPYVRFQSFEDRKFNLQYTKDEFLWYLAGNSHDLSICEKAKLWKRYVKADGSINSNYGQYVFGKQNQFDDALKELTDDCDTRRASIVILNANQVLSLDADLPCTYSINFRIRDGKLNMSVCMRSQDAMWGMGNDAPAFSLIHEMMFNALKTKYPDIQYGQYFHYCNSFHVYERHWEMLDNILANGECTYKIVMCPKMAGPEEVAILRNLHLTHCSDNDNHHFVKWLLTSEAK